MMGKQVFASPPFTQREALLKEMIRLAREDGLNPDEQNMRATLFRYPVEDIERTVDAFERFGVKTVLDSM